MNEYTQTGYEEDVRADEDEVGTFERVKKMVVGAIVIVFVVTTVSFWSYVASQDSPAKNTIAQMIGACS